MFMLEPGCERKLPIGKEAMSGRCCVTAFSSYSIHAIIDWRGYAI